MLYLLGNGQIVVNANLRWKLNVDSMENLQVFGQIVVDVKQILYVDLIKFLLLFKYGLNAACVNLYALMVLNHRLLSHLADVVKIGSSALLILYLLELILIVNVCAK